MNDWIVAITRTFPHEAHLIEGYLNSHGIGTLLKDEMTVQVNSAYSNAVGGIKILVRVSEYNHSIQVLKNGGYITDPNIQGEIDIEVFIVGYTSNHNICPFCNSENISIKKKLNTFSFIISTFLSLILFAVIAPIFKSVYKCFDCDKEWRYKRK